MAMQTYGNQEKKKTKNTKGIQLYNSDKVLGSTLALDYWQSFANIRINPLLPEERRSVKNVYDYEKQLTVLLPIEKIYDLLEASKYVAECIMEDNYNFEPVGVSVARGKQLIQIEPLSSLDGYEESKGIMIVLYNDIDTSNGTTNNFIRFVMAPSFYIKNYNYKEGTYDKSHNIESQFMVFVTYLKQSLKALTMANVHAQAFHDMYFKDSIKDSLYQLKQKAGIASTSTSSYNKGGTGFFENNNFKENAAPSFNSGSGSPNFSFAGDDVINGGLIMGDRLNLDD